MTENQLSTNMSIQEDVLKLRVENEQLKKQVSYLEDNLRVARKDREDLRDAVAKGLADFMKDRPFTSLSLLANKDKEKFKEENEQLKAQIEKMKCCGNCKHRNAEEVVETCRKLKNYTLIKGFCSEWEFAE